MPLYTLVKTKLAGKSLRNISLGPKIILKMYLKVGSKGTSNKRRLLLTPRSISVMKNIFIFQIMEQRWESTLKRGIRSGCPISRAIQHLTKEAVKGYHNLIPTP